MKYKKNEIRRLQKHKNQLISRIKEIDKVQDDLVLKHLLISAKRDELVSIAKKLDQTLIKMSYSLDIKNKITTINLFPDIILYLN